MNGKFRVFLCLAVIWAALACPAADVTFFSFGDSHYGSDAAETGWVSRVNSMAGWTYPVALGGGTVEAPRGVLAFGDLINDGGSLAKGTNEWAAWTADYGVNGEGVCKYPVYETFGNHDLSATRYVQKDIIARNQLRHGLTAISPNGLHYSWDWDGVHFVMLGVYPADIWTPENTYGNLHDPEYALEFLRWDLANNVGDSGRPVITMHHYDFLTDWWPDWQKLAYPRDLDGYNIILIMHGHQGAPYGYNWQGYDVTGQNGSLNVGHITTNNEILLATSTGSNTWGNTYRKSFTFPDLGRTWNPVPKNGSRNIATNLTQLAWRLGAYVVTQDVYFGTDSNAVATGSTPYLEGLAAGVSNCSIPEACLPLQPGTEYFWRVDQHNGEKPFSKGKVWSFRTRDDVRTNDITFLYVSDIHYQYNTLTGTKRTVKAMNAVPGTAYPDSLGGGTVDTPRGLLFGGDAATDSKQWQYNFYTNDYGLTGDRLLEYPVAPEINGNHDGGLPGIVANSIVARNRTRTDLVNISSNGLHCSWDWDGVHFVSLGVRPGVNTNPYNSHGALQFLESDLATNVGASGKAVVLYQHFGLDDYAKSWWTDAERAAYYEVIKNINVIAIFHGHTHSCTMYKWLGFDVYNAPHMEFGGSVTVPVTSAEGFYVCHITSNRLAVAERKADGTWGLNSIKPIFLSYATSGLPAVLHTGEATGISAGSATLQGNLVYVADGVASTAVTIYWGPNDGGTNQTAWSNSVALGTTGVGSFAAAVSNLQPEKLYYYRAYATNSAGGNWADAAESFTTLSARPVISCTAPDGVRSRAAILKGSLEFEADWAAPTTVTIYWGLSDGGTNMASWSNSVAVGTTTVGPFSAAVSNLQPETLYYYRAYATNSAGDSWAGAAQSFVTYSSMPAVSNSAPSGIAWNSALLQGCLVYEADGTAPTAVTIYWGPTDGGTNKAAWTNSLSLGAISVGPFAATVSNLRPETQYYYRSYATNSAGDNWAGQTASFATLSSCPMVSNTAATLITTNSAWINGLLLSPGAAPTYVWMYWGSSDGGTNQGAWAGQIDLGLLGVGAFSTNVSGLSAGSAYFFRAFASNSFGQVWAPGSASFVTVSGSGGDGKVYVWDNGAGTTNWNNEANWSNTTDSVNDSGFPNAAGGIALQPSAGALVGNAPGMRLNQNITVGKIVLNRAYGDNATFLAGTPAGKFIFDNVGSEALFEYTKNGIDQLTLTVNPNIELSDDLLIYVYSDRNGNAFNGVISDAAGETHKLRIRARAKTANTTGYVKLNNANSYKGGTVIVSAGGTVGRVIGAANGAFGAGDITVETNAMLYLNDIGTTDNMINDNAGLYLQSSGSDYAAVGLASGVNETISRLFFNGVPQAPGTWGSSSSTASNRNDVFFSGSGVLVVTGSGWTTIQAGSGAHGVIAPSGMVQVVYGRSQTFTITADAHYHVSSLEVNGQPQAAASTYTFENVTTNRTIQAWFAQNLATNDTPEEWLATHGFTNRMWDVEASDDQDGDGLSTWQEWLADTDPTNAESKLTLSEIRNENGQMRLRWKGGLHSTQYVERATVLDGSSWDTIYTNLPPLSGETNVLDVAGTNQTLYFRIRARR